MTKTIPNCPLSKDDITTFLSTKDKERKLFDYSSKIKQQNVGNEVFLRGLIELSNICAKDCYYCGIRHSNENVHRYSLSHEEVIELVKYAHKNGYGSVAIQSGELKSKAFIKKIDRILRESKQVTNDEIGITLSCGEQDEDTYRRWFESGANRYLLRIETSSEELYKKLHPFDELHNYHKRIKALEMLQKTGYQVGTGVMIGLPFQTTEMLADDLLFMKNIDIHMCGMGPYIGHTDTPLYSKRDRLISTHERFKLGLKMVALLRILMPDINIAATTAMQTLEHSGREKAIIVGANVLMPNITPENQRKDYMLYKDKPISTDNNADELESIEKRLEAINHTIGYYKQGNSKRFTSYTH